MEDAGGRLSGISCLNCLFHISHFLIRCGVLDVEHIVSGAKDPVVRCSAGENSAGDEFFQFVRDPPVPAAVGLLLGRR